MPKKMLNYQINTYDLIGNGEGGYEVNDVTKWGDVEIPEHVIDGNDRGLIRYLKKHGPIFKGTRFSSWEIYGEKDRVLFFSFKGNPAFEIVHTGDELK